MRVAERWFDVLEIDDGVLRVTEPYARPLIRANLYLVRGHDNDLLIDSGLGIASLRKELADLFERPVVAVATHRHYDHTGGIHEFEEIVAHRLDAGSIERGDGFAALTMAAYPPEYLQEMAAAGYDVEGPLLDALPTADYDPAAYRLLPATPTRIVDEGDSITTGDRTFEVLHLPGHTPGEIGLWEAETATLFSGDCVYESGDLLDSLPESNIEDYVRSMERLREVPVRVVLGGHDDRFGRERLLELIDDYVARRGRRGG